MRRIVAPFALLLASTACTAASCRLKLTREAKLSTLQCAPPPSPLTNANASSARRELLHN